MTRFARAKGSKSSNERVPDEATPWNVMKMQLEDSQASSKPVAKPKTARQLLTEKDEPFYHDNTGNVNHEWAAFDDVNVKEKKFSKDKGGKIIKNKDGKKEDKKIEKAAKLHLANHNEGNKTTEIVVKGKNQKQNEGSARDEPLKTPKTVDKVALKKKKKEKLGGIESENVIESQKPIENNVNDASHANDTLIDDKSDSKNKKRAKKSRKSELIANNAGEMANQSEKISSEAGESQKDELANSEADKKETQSLNVEGNSEKLSKRQKRNKKKQMKIASDKNEVKVKEVEEAVEKEGGPKGFDVLGNEWSNEVKFGRQNNPRESSAGENNEGDNDAGKIKNLDKRKEKVNKKKEGGEGDAQQNDNPTSENSRSLEKDDNIQSKKGQKRKGGKNDNNEYKRRKPDEGVVKMIINGNEIEVVKYDGFPVKKEDAERLKELKKNMIIKGIPRSEINVAMKLERRKAEKALTRERKRVCFHCRKSGHNLSDCPELGRDEAGSGICFKCGSAEHTHFECKVVKGQEFRHASCFICREQGHIARQCPDNPKGLYPQGGGCKICGDVTHLKKDCPDVIKEKEETNITADKIVGSQLESLQEDQTNVRSVDDNKTRSKIVKF